MAKFGSLVLLCAQSFVLAYAAYDGSPRDAGEAAAKASAFVASLNLTERIAMVTGVLGFGVGSCIGNIQPIPRLNFTGLCLLDGPQAINRADLVSVFPSGISAGASWDVDLMLARGKAMGEEFRDKGGHVMLGPVAGPLGRHSLGGRNWEGFSPDPYLAGRAMYATVQGVQSLGVQTCSKHYIGNEQETQRSNSFIKNGTEILAISSNIDDRTLHELYLWPFADAVRAGTSSIMCSYNRFNQTYSCENSKILNDILKGELGFEGYVVSDWFATHSGAQSINAGLDMNMPGPIDQSAIQAGSGSSYWGGNITTMLDSGLITEQRLGQMVKRIMLPYYYLKQDIDYPTVDASILLSTAAQVGYDLSNLPFPNIPSRDVRGNHSALIRKMGADGTVLLKNVNGTLPLKFPKNIGVFGNDAAPPINGIVFEDLQPFEIGTLDIGGGSGTGRPTYLVSPYEAIQAKAKELNARVQYIFNNKILAANDFRGIYPMPEVCLVFLNTFASESWDRTELEADWNSTLVVNNVAKRCPNTIVVTHSAGINIMPWAQNPNVTAILAAHLPGQELGNAIVDILWGDVNPSGKLPYSVPAKKEDYLIPIVNLTEAEVTSPGAWQSDFTEGQFIDYRHFDHFNIIPAYEFGFGLSYTTFEFQGSLEFQSLASNLSALPDADEKILPGGNAALWKPVLQLKARVKNTGSVAGATVPQLYVSLPAGLGSPSQVLRGFSKVNIAPGETCQVTFELLRRDLSYWDVNEQTWVLPSASITFKVGFSSRDIALTAARNILE